MVDPPKSLDPQKAICVVKVDGKEVGRIAARDPGAERFLTDLAVTYGGIHVDYEEEKPEGWFQPFV